MRQETPSLEMTGATSSLVPIDVSSQLVDIKLNYTGSTILKNIIAIHLPSDVK